MTSEEPLEEYLFVRLPRGFVEDKANTLSHCDRIRCRNTLHPACEDAIERAAQPGAMGCTYLDEEGKLVCDAHKPGEAIEQEPDLLRRLDDAWLEFQEKSLPRIRMDFSRAFFGESDCMDLFPEPVPGERFGRELCPQCGALDPEISPGGHIAKCLECGRMWAERPVRRDEIIEVPMHFLGPVIERKWFKDGASAPFILAHPGPGTCADTLVSTDCCWEGPELQLHNWSMKMLGQIEFHCRHGKTVKWPPDQGEKDEN